MPGKGRRKIKMMRGLLETSLTGVGLVAALVACTPTATSLEAPVSFLLRVGETERLEGGILTLSFEEVTSDSRCPKDALCVVAGEATVVFRARSKDREAALTFKIPPDGSDVRQFDDFKITIRALEPQPESGKTIDPGDYRADVLVESS